ncbi:unnamed protein product [Lactuca saligna]|uniref:Wax synthase domain-containing protein n=1 Tax=Lactuca saligna TaxID=75948 RepID=A0AA35Z0D0_LACSI|nr:unnamed protein product [Lactuca saligna]
MVSRAPNYQHMNNPVTSSSSAFYQELLQYEIPHSAMIQNIPKYDGTTDPDEHMDTYEWIMTPFRMDKRFTCTYFPVTLSGNASKWFKTLHPGSISSFEQLRTSSSTYRRSQYLYPTAISYLLRSLKLIRFAFDLDESPYRRSDSLIRFITVASLPVKTKSTDSTSVNTSPERSWYKLGLQNLIFSILVSTVNNYRDRFHPDIILVIYCGLLFLIIDIIAGVGAALLLFLTGLELEPSSNEPYLATSLQNFWGRWNLLVTKTLRYTVYKPVRSAFSDHKWAPHAGVLSSFFVSGLMHELFVYQLSREDPTWEMTSFFVIHGICVVVEMIIKSNLAGGRWRLPKFLATLLTVGFVVVTGLWLFFPPLIRTKVDVKVLMEHASFVDFIKTTFYSMTQKSQIHV